MNPEPDPVKAVACGWLCPGMYRPAVLLERIRYFSIPRQIFVD